MVYFYIIIFLLHIMESISGFGSTAIGIPILSLFLGTEPALLLVSTAGHVLCAVVFISQYKKTAVRELLIILAVIMPFLPIGYLLYAQMRGHEALLRLIMGVIVTFVSSREIYRRLIKKDEGDPPRWLVYGSLGVGAVAQGMLSMGGALINVYALTRIKDKSAFRATMVSVWLITNTISMCFRLFVLKAYTADIWMAVLYSVPLVLIAFYIGNKLHHKIADQSFISLVYFIQLISGLISIASGLSLFS